MRDETGSYGDAGRTGDYDYEYDYDDDDTYRRDGHSRGRGRRGGGFRRGWADFLIDYIRSRRTEHWIMFLAGAFIGIIIG